MVGFSIELAIVDFIVPILFLISFIILNKNLKFMDRKTYYIFNVGMIISLFFGFIIPFYKLLVGLGLFNFNPPVNLVIFGNFGLLIGGICLLISVSKEKDLDKLSTAGLLIPVGALNMIGIVFGIIGMIFIYISLIKISKVNNLIKPIIFVIISFCIMLIFGYLGSSGDITSALSHWILEFLNIGMQLSLLLAIFSLFYKKSDKSQNFNKNLN